MNKKREIVVKLMLMLIAVIVVALFVAAVKTVIDDLYIEHHKIVYQSIPIEPVNTKQYSDTWDGEKIVEIDGHPIKDGETVKILVK